MKLSMTADEQVLFEACLRRSRSYVEFGAGGSTYLASSLVGERIVSVDSSREWLDKVGQAVAQHPDWVQPQLVLVDIGPIGQWGNPADRSREADWHRYSTQVWELPDTAEADLFLIDGRFRVASAIEALRRCRADALVLVHDYTSRQAYHAVEAFGRCVAQSGALAMLVRRPDFDDAKAGRAAEKHRLITA